MRGSIAALAAASVLILMGGVAAAHANYVKSNPASDARLTKAPTEIRVTFSETPDARGSDIAVLDVSGNRFDSPRWATVAISSRGPRSRPSMATRRKAHSHSR